MGTIASLLFLPFTAPVSGFRFFLERIRDEAESVLYDEGRTFAELIDLGMRRSAGQLSEAEYTEEEAALLERLRAIRAYREEMVQVEWDESDEYVLNDESPDVDEEGW